MRHVHSPDAAIGVRRDPTLDCCVNLLERGHVVFAFELMFTITLSLTVHAPKDQFTPKE
jgi:hypothetical protein